MVRWSKPMPCYLPPSEPRYMRTWDPIPPHEQTCTYIRAARAGGMEGCVRCGAARRSSCRCVGSIVPTATLLTRIH